MPVPAIPVATYRLQFNRDFTFAQATALVPYLHDLGISHVYASPYLKARPGSTHGYDIVDHNALNPEIGSSAEFDQFCGALQARGMGQTLDFVPNHMGVGKADNEWWLDTLEWGEASPYADFFDIDWTAARRNFRGKVLLPVLGDQYGIVLESGELKLKFNPEQGTFSVWYHDHRFPIRVRDYAAIIRHRLGDPTSKAGAEAAELLEGYAGEFAIFSTISRSRIKRGDARARAAALKAELGRLAASKPEATVLLQEAANLYNGDPGKADSFVWLHNLLERQFYRLSYWRTAADEINYRRFFEINDLAGIRPENPRLFAAIHQLVAQLIANGCVHGLRIDHIDGLFDPAAYCQALQELAQGCAPPVADRLERDEKGRPTQFYIIVEKILARHERLRESWPVAGTSGYEFLNQLNGVFVDPDGELPLTRIYRDFAGVREDFEQIVYDCKKLIIDNALASELAVLASQLDRMTEQDWRTRDFTRVRLRDALKEIVACFPVYRTYVSEAGVASEDERDIDWAVSQAKKRWQAPDPEIFDFVRDMLLVRRGVGPGSALRRAEVLRFAMKFQQYTGPVTAKSIEDTAFYRYHRLISLNEVGGDPRQFGISVSALHHLNEERARHWPHTMLATATHDTKRGEDARARINVLSELAPEWGERVERWCVLNRYRRTEIDDEPTPSRNDEYLFYQTLVGVWPAEWTGLKPEPGPLLGEFQERLSRYALKAVREAKLRTSWTRPDEAFEQACAAFLSGLVDTTKPNLFLDDFLPFQAKVAFFGMLNSLAQMALKLTSPGVPDIYRGCELWDLSLVDPDNRRAVDFERRMDCARALKAQGDWAPDERAAQWNALRATWQTGNVKLALAQAILALRRAYARIFTFGSYLPLTVDGVHADHVFAFGRESEGAVAIVAVGRLFARLWGGSEPQYDAERWEDTRISLVSLGPIKPDAARDALTGEVVPLAGARDLRVGRLFRSLPVSVLVANVPANGGL